MTIIARCFSNINGLKIIFFISLFFMFNCSSDDTSIAPVVEISPDLNNDGELNILVIGTSKSINSNSGAFASNRITTELENILSQDGSFDLDINIYSEDIYNVKEVTYGDGPNGPTTVSDFYCHSLLQYYFWPEYQEERLENLKGEGNYKWDYVVIGADPYLVAKLPGYYSLGVNKIASKIVEGGAKPLLLMLWPQDESLTASLNHFSEYTHRTADGAKVSVEVIPAGRAWNALPNAKKDDDIEHPTPNGAYLTAAAIYSQIRGKSATHSGYQYDDEIADIALATKINETEIVPYTGERLFTSPFKSCDISDSVLNYSHTGTSTENGILAGLHWVINQTNRTLWGNGTPPINFNYGRANTNFEANKRYKINPDLFDFSFGFPMQDKALYGNTSMLYGLDKRINESNNATDLGVALYMVRNSELPNARAIPVRTLYAQIKEVIPTQSAYRDNTHMHRHLDKAIAAYMYTLLTGDCALGEEPTDQNSIDWSIWLSSKIGYETAYSLMHLKGEVPICN